MVAQLIAGETPDARYGEVGKQRSTHNTTDAAGAG